MTRMKPEKPALTASQKPLAKDSAGAGVLLLILLFAFLPWQMACLAIGAIIGVAFPFVLIERQIVFAYNDGRRTWPWEILAYVLAAVMLVALWYAHLWKYGLWP